MKGGDSRGKPVPRQISARDWLFPTVATFRTLAVQVGQSDWMGRGSSN